MSAAIVEGASRSEFRAGALVAVEGVDGSGKSTLARALAGALRTQGVRARVVRPLSPEPGFLDAVHELHRRVCSRALDARKEDFVSAYLTYRLAAAALELERDVARGIVVVADRYGGSHEVNQAVFGVDLAPLAPLLATLPPADATLYLRADPAVALARLAGRSARGAGDSPAFVRRAAALFDAKARASGWTVLDAADEPGALVAAALQEVAVHVPALRAPAAVA